MKDNALVGRFGFSKKKKILLFTKMFVLFLHYSIKFNLYHHIYTEITNNKQGILRDFAMNSRLYLEERLHLLLEGKIVLNRGLYLIRHICIILVLNK